MNLYEMTFIVRPDLDEEQTLGVAELITQRLQGAGGEIAAAYPWTPPRRRLAYPIRDFNDGYYVTTVFRIEPSALREFENGLKLNENILRFLIVQATENNIRQAQQRLQAMTQAAQAPQGPPQGAPQAPAGAPVPVEASAPVAPSGPAPAVAPAPQPAAADEAPLEAGPVSAASVQPEVVEIAAVEPDVVEVTAVEAVPASETAPEEGVATPAGSEE